MTKEERQKLREVASRAVRARFEPSTDPSPWELQTSNSWRRIGTRHGDGDILCGITQQSDGHPDLHAPPGVLDYIVASQPAVVLALLDELDALEDKLRAAYVICNKVEAVEKRLNVMATAFVETGVAMTQLLVSPTVEDVAKARALLDQLVTALREDR